YVADPGGLDPPGWIDLPPSLRDRVVRLIAWQSGRPEVGITPDLTFSELDAHDSLDTVELVMELEEEFGITISDDEAEQIKTVEQLVQYLAWKSNSSGNSGPPGADEKKEDHIQ